MRGKQSAASVSVFLVYRNLFPQFGLKLVINGVALPVMYNNLSSIRFLTDMVLERDWLTKRYDKKIFWKKDFSPNEITISWLREPVSQENADSCSPNR